jgi:sucrose phosphorylase
VDAWLRAGRELARLYGPAAAADTTRALQDLVERWGGHDDRLPRRGPLAARDCLAIAYPDHITAPGEVPLETLGRFLDTHLAGVVTGVHVLPCYPWSSDEGFAVKDYEAVDPAYGGWADVTALAGRYRLMLDLVLNHASAQGAWFRRFLAAEPGYERRFLVVEGELDLSAVVRPRTTPLLTPFQTVHGTCQAWTTFGPDQVDLDYRDPATLLAMVGVLLGYVARGATLIRLDAVAFLWKRPGSACLHLDETHAVVRLLRAVLDAAAPQVLLVTETNVPHDLNLSYFGHAGDEAQLVYNFALPPLVLQAFLTGEARLLTEWAGGLAVPSGRATFLNFLASHDGIGLNPVRDLLSETDLSRLIATVRARGGRVSQRAGPAGESLPYELNINYLDALIDGPGPAGAERGLARFLCAHAIAMALVGVPLVYLHSLLGSRGAPVGPADSPRAVNRERLRLGQVERDLARPRSRRARTLAAFRRLAEARRRSPAFDPYGPQETLSLAPGCFALRRWDRDRGAAVLCAHNVTGGPLAVDLARLGGPAGGRWLVAERCALSTAQDRLDLGPYGYAWWAADG